MKIESNFCVKFNSFLIGYKFHFGIFFSLWGISSTCHALKSLLVHKISELVTPKLQKTAPQNRASPRCVTVCILYYVFALLLYCSISQFTFSLQLSTKEGTKKKRETKSKSYLLLYSQVRANIVEKCSPQPPVLLALCRKRDHHPFWYRNVRLLCFGRFLPETQQRRA